VNEPSVVACERVFQTLIDGVAEPIRVVWMQPRREPLDWTCECIIEWPRRPPIAQRVYGVDSAQALLLAMQMVSAKLYLAEPQVFWFEPDDVLGLPVVPAVAELEAARTKGRLPDG
jgi:hypothetical protein